MGSLRSGRSANKLTIMKSLLLSLLGILLLAGCSSGYVLRTSNGASIRTANKPKLVNGFYYFKDSSGRDAVPVFAGNVTEISPASMASKDSQPEFKSSPAK